MATEFSGMFPTGAPCNAPSAAPSDGRKVVILSIAAKHIALLVDDLFRQESTVIKPPGFYPYQGSRLAGATINGGDVRLALDRASVLTAFQTAAKSARKASA